MDITLFKASLKQVEPPQGISVYLTALWYDANGYWEKAHTLVQDVPGRDAALIHAYLHRKEGDEGNAGYWYHRAGVKHPGISLDKEWQQLVTLFLGNG